MEREIKDQEEGMKTADEALTTLQTISALMNVLPGDFSAELSVQIVYDLFMSQESTLKILEKAPQKVIEILRQYITERQASRWL